MLASFQILRQSFQTIGKLKSSQMPTFCNFSSCYCLETDSWEIEIHHVNIGKFILLREQNIWWILLWEENWQIINLIRGFDIFNIKFSLHILLSFQELFSFCCTIPLTFPLNLGLCKGFWGVVRKDDQLVHSEISHFIPPGTDCNCKKISNIYMFEINFPPRPVWCYLQWPWPHQIYS